ncbi:MAG TPA: hypothetical protein VFV53_04220 [Candidatus Limnocylindrales bacterium]|nr:hypothetical protein [Candidatus Limnocylindrales bacterium]
MPRPLLVLLAAACLASCGGELTKAPARGTPTPGSSATTTPAPRPTDDLVQSIARGPWRQHPVGATPDLSRRFEDGCRASEAGIGALPVAVVDLRGDELVTVVFGDATAGYVCWSPLDSPEAPLEVRALDVAPDPVDGIDAALYGPLQIGEATRVVLIGRVGPLSQPRQVLGGQVPAEVVAQLGDEAFIWAAFDRGWYVMWWPGVDPTESVAAINGRHEVLASVTPAFP